MPRTEEQFEQMRRRTRTKLLAAAADLFADRGFTATTVAAVAAKARVATGLLYQHFPGKDDLLAAIVTEAQADLARLLDELVRASPAPDLQGFSCALIRALDEERSRWRMLLQVLLQDRAMKAVPRVRLKFSTHLAEAITRIDPVRAEHPGLAREAVPDVVHNLIMAFLATEDAETACTMATALFRRRTRPPDKPGTTRARVAG